MSKPKISKQVLRSGTIAQQFIRVRSNIYSILTHSYSHGSPEILKWLLNYSKLHLSPEPYVLLLVTLEEFLLIELLVKCEY